MKISRIISVVVIGALLTLSLSSCNSGKSPKKVVEESVNALLQGDMDTFYSHLSSVDREAITAEYFREMVTISGELDQLNIMIPEAKEAYKVKKLKETISGDIATVTFELTYPDFDEIGKNAINLSDLMSIANEKGSFNNLQELPADLKNKIVEYVKEKGMPTKKSMQQISLVKEDKEWKIKLDVANLVKAGQKQISPFAF